MIKECSVEWCNVNTRAKNSEWCERHYYQMRRNGVVLPKPVVYVECVQCGKETDNKKYCSRRCRTRFSRHRSEDDRQCIVCQGKIPSQYRVDKIYCSIKCRTKNSGAVMNRRARELNCDGEHSNIEWAEIVSFYDGRCLVCSIDKVSKDHIVPLSKGGSNYPWNLQPLCMKHNRAKWVDDTDYRTSEQVEAQLGLINYIAWLEEDKYKKRP